MSTQTTYTKPMIATTGQERISRVRTEQFGYLTPADVAFIAAQPETRLFSLLVRCHEGRFSAPAQDVANLIAIVEQGGWHVRDVSLPAR